jgi:hypothetical protein
MQLGLAISMCMFDCKVYILLCSCERLAEPSTKAAARQWHQQSEWHGGSTLRRVVPVSPVGEACCAGLPASARWAQNLAMHSLAGMSALQLLAVVRRVDCATMHVQWCLVSALWWHDAMQGDTSSVCGYPCCRQPAAQLAAGIREQRRQPAGCGTGGLPPHLSWLMGDEDKPRASAAEAATPDR